MDPSNLLSLPTDSLYKFMAISGLVIFFISAIFPFYLKQNFAFKQFDLLRDHKLSGIRKNEAIRKYEILKADRIANAIDLESSTLTVEVLRKAIEEGTQTKDTLNEMIEEQVQIAIVLENTICELEKIKFLSNALKVINRFSVIGIFVGLSLSISGFYFWYVKLQVLVDHAVATGAAP